MTLNGEAAGTFDDNDLHAPIMTKSGGNGAVGGAIAGPCQRRSSGARASGHHRRRSSLQLFKRKTTLATVFVANFTVYTALSVLSAFFPVYAQEKFHASSLLVGVIFAAHPLTEVVLTPLASFLCRRLGRDVVFRFGLLVISGSIALFGWGDSIEVFLLSRVLEGVGSAFVQVAGLALLMEHTENLIRDVAINELMSGVGYAVGPFFGGLLYQAVGMLAMYIGFSLVPLAICIIHTLTAWIHFPGGADPPRAADVEDIFKMGSYLTPAVAGACTSIVVTAASYGFLDLTLSAHLNRALGFSPAQVREG